MKPVIGIVANKDMNRLNMAASMVTCTYVSALEAAGGVPIVFPFTLNSGNLVSMLSSVDGVLFPGGGDVDPQLYDEPENGQMEKVDRELDCFQMIMARLAIERQMPVLGICRGIQLINIVLGGTLVQDIPTQMAESALSHQGQGISRTTEHEIDIVAGTRLHSFFGTRIMVNSWHHQSIDELGKGLVVSAMASDGVIEAAEHRSLPVDLVQWHPELMMQKSSDMLPLFNAFVEKCKSR